MWSSSGWWEHEYNKYNDNAPEITAQLKIVKFLDKIPGYGKIEMSMKH
jgi:hypothetical protein